MSSNHQSELDSTPPIDSNHHPPHDLQPQPPRVRFMCSFNGKILPRPHDNQLRYIGGDTRIVAVNRHNTTFSVLLNKLSKLYSSTKNSPNLIIKYQLPNEDLDSLITVSTDEDVENMMEEYDRLIHLNLAEKMNRIRIFLFSAGDAPSRASSISSLLDGSVSHDNWFFDALNGGSASGIQRGRSEASSILSEVPDFLFGFDNSDETQPSKVKSGADLSDYSSVTDTGSPKFVQLMPELAQLKFGSDNPIHLAAPKDNQPMPMYNYYPGPAMPVYYVPAPGPPTFLSGQQVPIHGQYVQQYSGPLHQVSGMGQAYPLLRPGSALDSYYVGMNQQVYYGVESAPIVPGYTGMETPSVEELVGSGSNGRSGRI